MDHLYRTCGIERFLFGRAEIGGHLDGEDGPDPFPSGQQAVPHGLVERTRIDVSIRDEFGETLIDPPTPTAGSIPLIFVTRSQSKPAVGIQTFNTDTHFQNVSTSLDFVSRCSARIFRLTFSSG